MHEWSFDNTQLQTCTTLCGLACEGTYACATGMPVAKGMVRLFAESWLRCRHTRVLSMESANFLPYYVHTRVCTSTFGMRAKIQCASAKLAWEATKFVRHRHLTVIASSKFQTASLPHSSPAASVGDVKLAHQEIHKGVPYSPASCVWLQLCMCGIQQKYSILACDSSFAAFWETLVSFNLAAFLIVHTDSANCVHGPIPSTVHQHHLHIIIIPHTVLTGSSRVCDTGVQQVYTCEYLLFGPLPLWTQQDVIARPRQKTRYSPCAHPRMYICSFCYLHVLLNWGAKSDVRNHSICKIR